MMKTMIVSAVALFCVATANQANACRYAIDEQKISDQLSTIALANLGTVKVLDSSVSGLSYFESKPTRMCPKEMTYSAVVSAVYESGMNVCNVELTVKKVESWSSESDQDSYTVTGRQSARCRK